MDSACQTLRPLEVTRAVQEYYLKYNACGERVKYPWGERVDNEVESTRKKVLHHIGKSSKDYIVCFTHNTTVGINLVLSQLDAKKYSSITTSDIEHNSVFLPSITYAKKHGCPRYVLERNADGSLPSDTKALQNTILLVNTCSNIDGRRLSNGKEIANIVHESDGLVLIDAAQSFGHHPADLKEIDFDACFTSSHKSYGPSMGVIAIKKSLLEILDISIIGGGMVSDVTEHDFELLEGQGHEHARLEMGLQSWEGIIGLGAALSWIRDYKVDGKDIYTHCAMLEQQLYEGLKKIPKLHLTSDQAGSSISFYHEEIDSHQLALLLAQGGAYARSGYFCCHYYLKNKLELPPLLRLSIGAHLSHDDIQVVLQKLSHIFSTLT